MVVGVSIVDLDGVKPKRVTSSLSIFPTKALAKTLMTKLLTMKYDDHSSIKDHIMQMIDIPNKLKSMDVEISNGFLVLFILNSLPAHYDKLNQNTLEVVHLEETDSRTTPHIHKKNDRKEINYHFCRKKGHLKRNCLKYKKCFLLLNNKDFDLSKDIEIKYLVVKEKVGELVVSIEHISTELMIDVTLTKGLSPKWFVEHVAHMDLTNIWDAIGQWEYIASIQYVTFIQFDLCILDASKLLFYKYT
ncbi:hypothetical protein AMTRI_Chr05g64190 [Amborella trichopoda]